MMEATVFLGTLNAAEHFWYPSPDLCLDTILSRTIPLTSLSNVGPYIDRCVPFQIMSNQLNLLQVDSMKLKKHLKDNQWKKGCT
jgi:hypothetical protein